MHKSLDSKAVDTHGAGRDIRWKHRLEYLALRAVGALIQAMSLDRASALMGRLWRSAAPLTARHARALRHIKRAMPALSDAEAKHIIRDMWEHLGRVFAEGFHLAQLARERHRISYDRAVVQDLMQQKSGILCVSLHAGNWELGTLLFGCEENASAAGIYRRASNSLSDAYIKALRAPLYPGGLFPKGHAAAAAILRHVRAGGVAGMLADLRDDNGLDVMFFGRPAASTPFPAMLAYRLDVPLVVVRCKRLEGVRFHMDITPLTLERSGDRNADIARTTATIQRMFEDWIRDNPSQWMWATKRWDPDTL